MMKSVVVERPRRIPAMEPPPSPSSQRVSSSQWYTSDSSATATDCGNRNNTRQPPPQQQQQRIRGGVVVLLLLLHIVPQQHVSSFSLPQQQQQQQQPQSPLILRSRRYSSPSSSFQSFQSSSFQSSQLRMVFERMSEECIEILMLAQEYDSSSSSKRKDSSSSVSSVSSPVSSSPVSIDTTMILMGCCAYAARRGSASSNRQSVSPSIVAIQKTLSRYTITMRRLETILLQQQQNNNRIIKTLSSSSSTSMESASRTTTKDQSSSSSSLPSWLSPFGGSSSQPSNDKQQQQQQQQPDKKQDRPFATSSKYCMNRAMQIANRDNNPLIEAHYLFLALLDYQPSMSSSSSSGSSSSSSSSIPTDPSATESNEVWTTILSKVVNTNINKDKTNDDNNDDDDTGTTTVSNNNNNPINITALDICQTCIMYYDQEVQRRKGRKELVLSSGSSSSGSSKSTTTTTSVLDDIGMDLTQMAQDELLDVVHGRDNEIQSCLRTLLRRRKNNIILLGNAGVGKTAIVEGLAQFVLDKNKCPRQLYNARIISIEISNLLANTKYRGEFEERLQAVIAEVTQSQQSPRSILDEPPPRIILFFDEIHTIMGTGNAGGGEGGSIDAANILKPALARGTVQLIGATTIEEYRSSIEKDTAFARRLQPIYITEPNNTQCIDILQNCIQYYEDYHMVQYSTGAIRAAVELSERYINDRFLPDKAIDLIDEAGAMIQLQRSNNNNNDNSFYDNNFDDERDDEDRPVVTEEIMMQLISEWTGIPMGKIELSELDKLVSIEKILSSRVIGQPRPIVSVSRAIRRARSGLQDPKRPIASFMFCGPTGVGKTELCKSLADIYYGNEKDMIRIDMSEYQDRYTVSRLTGPPPGYVGYESGGQLTEAVRRNSHSLVLLDEIEKAHEDVLNILLQILEDGILTDGKGRTINFKNTIIVMTSNIGSRRILELSRTNNSGSSSSSSSSGLDAIRDSMKDTIVGSDSMNDNSKEHHLYPQLIEVVKEELESTMKPELLNRIDEIVVFSPLSHDHLTQIAQLNVDRIVKRIFDEHNITISVSNAILNQIVNDGSVNADQFGARPMRRATQRFVEDSISDAYIQGFLRKNDDASLSIPNDNNANNDRVMITKFANHADGAVSRAESSIIVDIVDSSGGIGSSSSAGTRRNQQEVEYKNDGDDDDDDGDDDDVINGRSLPLPELKTSPSQ